MRLALSPAAVARLYASRQIDRRSALAALAMLGLCDRKAAQALEGVR